MTLETMMAISCAVITPFFAYTLWAMAYCAKNEGIAKRLEAEANLLRAQIAMEVHHRANPDRCLDPAGPVPPRQEDGDTPAGAGPTT